MGYYTYITGAVTVTPELDPKHEAQLVTLECFQEEYFTIGDTRATVGGDTVALVNGVVTVVPGKGTPGSTEIKIGFEESVKAYDFDDQVHTLVTALAALGYGVNGAFDGDGEESDDFWRIHVVNNVVATERGVVTFQSSDPYLELRERAKNGHGWVLPQQQGIARSPCGGAGAQCPDCIRDHFWVQQVLGL